MEGPEWHGQCVELQPPPTNQTQLLLCDSRVESVLLYGSECWTLKPTLQKSLDGCYTRMLRVVLNINKSAHISNNILYAGIPRVSDKIAARRMRLAGHCQRHQELPASKLVLWEPTHGHRSRGRPTLTYVDVLKMDTGAHRTPASRPDVWRTGMTGSDDGRLV